MIRDKRLSRYCQGLTPCCELLIGAVVLVGVVNMLTAVSVEDWLTTVSLVGNAVLFSNSACVAALVGLLS